ncbi:MAG: hypothetical protein WBV36_01550 [Terriglobales bacterium]
MKPTMTISVCVLSAGLALAQNPSVIQNTRATMNGVRDNSTAASNTALGAQYTPAASNAGSASAARAHTPYGKRPMHTVTGETKTDKTAKAPKLEPVAPVAQNQKKIGEIVGNAAPTAADGTSPDDSNASAKYNANGKRDPFLSPVVAHAGGPSCATGKKCLEIGSVNLRGVVHSENGFIAVVSNSLNKAYFLRENDPVFNGYVVKITGDSIIFQETLQDRLGKTFTREVTKKITVPAV